MASRRDKFPDQPEELPLSIDTSPDVTTQRFNPDQLRAFGSIPNMIASNIDAPAFDRLDTWAWEHSAPAALESGLFGRPEPNGTAVNGLVLGAEYYTAIIRNQDAFEASIRAKTLAANRNTNDIRLAEKELRSAQQSLVSKKTRHEKVLTGLADVRNALDTVSDMQRTPGYHRNIGEADVRLLATTVWEQSFMAMLGALKDHHGLTNEQTIDMTQAMSYRLLRGPQNDKVKNWGEMLRLGTRYNRSTSTLFARSAHQIDLRLGEVEQSFDDLYERFGIQTPGQHVVARTVEIDE